MAQNVGSGLTSITGTVSVSSSSALPTAGLNQTIKAAQAINGSLVSATNLTVYTVTATKTFYLTSLQWSSPTVALVNIYIQDGSGSQILDLWDYGTASVVAGNTLVFPTPIAFTNSVVLKNVTGSNINVKCNVQGFEQ